MHCQTSEGLATSILVVFGPNDVEQLDDVRMPSELLQEHDLSEGPLRIGLVPERVEDLLEGNSVARPPIRGLPYDAVCAFAKPFVYVIALAYSAIDILRHSVDLPVSSEFKHVSRSIIRRRYHSGRREDKRIRLWRLGNTHEEVPSGRLEGSNGLLEEIGPGSEGVGNVSAATTRDCFAGVHVMDRKKRHAQIPQGVTNFV